MELYILTTIIIIYAIVIFKKYALIRSREKNPSAYS